MTIYCTKCGATETEAGQFGMIETVDYDWDSDDDTALSVQRVTGHTCADASVCAERNIQGGYNPEALREIVRDAEHYSLRMREDAREALREMSETARMMARGQDAAAREIGYGAIGGGLHSYTQPQAGVARPRHN